MLSRASFKRRASSIWEETIVSELAAGTSDELAPETHGWRVREGAVRRYVGVRFAQIILTIFCLITLQFFLFRAVPGDPIAAYIDQSLPIETREAIRKQFGLD